ncbi:outer membrane beta-barrel protein [Spirosoma agri]|uniref:Outer membrane beta-barrel protein n=1 Tax=Spirosoma agri TaxID=1987381 RepID=A0A6M0IC19_9BACT|nr:outer membrane beta-barrel protein [Spirosoma agri]NEU65285.1 outer membrane beta-barrel protein [Spirosoma agri]
MDEIDKNIPDDFWRKAFDEASEAPPPRVWKAIEHRLDESNGTKIIPLWTAGLLASKPLTWGVGLAAALALLLVGWWTIGSQSRQPSHQQLAQQEASKQTTQHASSKPVDGGGVASIETNKPESEALASVDKKTANSAEQPVPAPTIHPEEHAVARLSNRLPKPSVDQLVARIASQSTANNEQHSTVQRLVRSTANAAMSHQASVFIQPSNSSATVAFTTMTPVADVNRSESDQLRRNSIEQLDLRPMRLRSPGKIQRIVWFRPTELSVEPEATKSRHESRQVWASVSMMPSSFNPAVSLRSTQTAAFANSARTSQPSINSRSNFSVAYQAGAGVQLSDHWSVESGIGYLAARSTVESPSQVASGAFVSLAADQASTSGNLYVNAVRSSLITSNMAYSNTPKASYDNVATATNYQAYNSPYQQELSNNFEYVQVPLQLGYQIRPRKRLSMAVLGGLLTNIFVRNTIGDDLVVTGKDGVYRPVSWAATMGARFRYRPSRRWSASLAGMYQPTLGETTQPTSQVHSSPTSTGMSFGLDYHF